MWAAFPRQQSPVEEANQRLSKKSTEADELCVVTMALKEEAAEARDTAAKALEDVAKAREEVAKARDDLAPLLARVKELEEDVTLVSRHRDALNVQIGQVSAHVGTLKNEVATLKGTVRERDEALSGVGQEIKMLRATVHDRDEALQAAEKVHDELRDEIMGWKTHAEGKPLPSFDLDFGLPYFC
jgi:chromosome segregation ATPase